MALKNTIKGQCLCGAVKFILKKRSFGLYQCHCSECRKITGSNANSSIFVPEEYFSWNEGKNNITKYIHVSGYRSDFCASCGSPVPNKMKTTAFYWVPAGALDENANLTIKAHLCVKFKAKWEQQKLEGSQYDEAPKLEELCKVLGHAGK